MRNTQLPTLSDSYEYYLRDLNNKPASTKTPRPDPVEELRPPSQAPTASRVTQLVETSTKTPQRT